MGFFKRDTEALKSQAFDVLIVGGGISGAWLALHCARSGYKTSLIEQEDYASQTSSSSSKLLHGGIRYLQQMQFSKVRESAMERAHYVYSAPHLSTPVPFLIPTYKDFSKSKFFLSCGMLAYRMLTLGENALIDNQSEELPSVSSLDRGELNTILNIESEPHTGAIQFYERHMHDSERMVLEVLKTAAKYGAEIANYCRADQLIQDQNCVQGITVIDRLNDQKFDIESKLVINAAGPWIDDLNSQLENENSNINGYSVGAHIITRQISTHAIALTTKHQSNAKIDRGGRHIFIIPWCGYSLIGTSYDEIDHAEKDIIPTKEHILQLLEAVSDALPSVTLKREDLISGYAGLYNLNCEDIDSSVYQGSGEYVIIDHQKASNTEGLLTALGAKFTTGRKLSELSMPFVKDKLGGEINTQAVKLYSAEFESFMELHSTLSKRFSDRINDEVLTHLLQRYGSQTEALLATGEADPNLLTPICKGQLDIKAQVLWAIREEQAQSLEDVLYRRTSVAFFPISKDEIHSIASLIAKELNWSEDEMEQQIQMVNLRMQRLSEAFDQAFNELNREY